MKVSAFAVFITVVLIVFTAVNFYIGIRGWQALPANGAARKIFLPLFIIVATSFFTGRLLERFWVSWLSDFFVWAGSFWLAFMLYFFLLIVFLDGLRLINHFIPFFPELIVSNYAKVKLTIAITGFLIIMAMIVYGYFNAWNVRIKKLNIEINKSAGNLKTLNMVMVSDVHLGTINNRSKLNQLIRKINGLNPDIIVFAGDLVDEDIASVIRHKLGNILIQLKSKYGMYAVTGNHEFIGGAERSCSYLSEHGVKIIRDTVVMIDNAFYLIGREDKDKKNFTGSRRAKLDVLMKQTDRSYPVIVIDHQPSGPEDAARAGADLQLSGHTHAGQMFPFNLIVNKLYKIPYGYKKINNTHFYVSSGAGTWAPPVRIGSRPEIVNVLIHFR